jgi:hypothetical protein
MVAQAPLIDQAWWIWPAVSFSPTPLAYKCLGRPSSLRRPGTAARLPHASASQHHEFVGPALVDLPNQVAGPNDHVAEALLLEGLRRNDPELDPADPATPDHAGAPRTALGSSAATAAAPRPRMSRLCDIQGSDKMEPPSVRQGSRPEAVRDLGPVDARFGSWRRRPNGRGPMRYAIGPLWRPPGRARPRRSAGLAGPR